jgi:hypothetical protein
VDATGSNSAVTGVEGTGRRRLADPAPTSTGWHPAVPADAPADTGGGRRRRREADAAETGAWPPQPAAEPAAPGGGRRRLREPDTAGSGSWLPHLPAESVAEAGGWRHRSEAPAGPSVTSPAEPRSGRRRAAEPAPQGGTRRTLGAEYLIDTGEQAVWTGGARRYAPQPEPPTEPFTPAPQPSAAAESAAQPAGEVPARPRGRHAAPEDRENATATVQLRALIGDLDPDRPTGRHRRPRQ